jgi:hypothetical protein
MADEKKPSSILDKLSGIGINTEDLKEALAGVPAATAEKPKKSGTYVSTQISSNIPPASTLADYINTVFQKYKGRDANPTELKTWLPAVTAQYKSEKGKSKSTIKYTYKDGELLKTEYLTANGEDPKLWIENKVKADVLAGKQDVNALAIPEGPSGKYFVALKNVAARNGIMLSDSAATDYANGIVAGKIDEDTAYNTIRESAAEAFPALADKIKAGIDLKTLADPYIQSMSSILEIPDTGIDMFDPKIRNAMAYTLPDGKIGTRSIYEFERELRKDPRWQYTDNARNDAASIATTVLKDFGFMR